MVCLTNLLLLFLMSAGKITAIWTEEDEKQRIAMIINNDRRAFEQEMLSQKRVTEVITDKHNEGRDPQSVPISKSIPNNEPEKEFEHWCFHCVSPLKHMSSDMRKTIRQFLRLRRTSYPQEVATDECTNAKNFSRLHKQTCRHPYCTTISLVDHNQGVSFVMRGCAENFGAIDTNFLAKHGAHSCSTLHEHLDMRECLCSERRYCLSGHSRRSSSINRTSLFPFPLLLIAQFLALWISS
ncbi:hypothetical protein V3C99_012138 [Haemonchus contortus]